MERRVAEAVSQAVANAERDGEEAMNDLLVCLGQVRAWHVRRGQSTAHGSGMASSK